MSDKEKVHAIPADSVEEPQKVEIADEYENMDGDKLEGGVWAFPRLLARGGGLIMLALTVFVTVTVFMRFFGSGIMGAIELSAITMVVITVLVVPAATAADENFRVELIDFFVSRKALRGFNLLGLIVQLVVLLFICYAVISLFLSDVSTLTYLSDSLHISRYWLTAIVVLGFVGALYATVINLKNFKRDQDALERDKLEREKEAAAAVGEEV